MWKLCVFSNFLLSEYPEEDDNVEDSKVKSDDNNTQDKLSPEECEELVIQFI